MHGTRVPSLVRGQRSHMLCSTAKKLKKKSCEQGQENYYRIPITLIWLIVGAITTPGLKRQEKVNGSRNGGEKEIHGEGCRTEALNQRKTANSTPQERARGTNTLTSLCSLPPVSCRYLPLTQPNQKPEGSLIKVPSG